MPSFNLRNALKRNPNRLTLKQRAAALKATAGRVLRRRLVEAAPVVAGADPRFVALVGEWQEARRMLNDPKLSDDAPVLVAMGERDSDLQLEIYRFPARSVADLHAKIPVFRDEAQPALSGYAGQDPEETLPGSAWAGLFRDFENLVGAMPAVLTQADACLLEAEAVFSAAEVALDEQWERMNAAEDAHAPPPMPAALKIRGNDWMYTSIPQPSIMRRAGGSETYGAEEVEILRTRPCMQRTFGGSEGERQPDHSRISPDKMAQARADTIVAAWDEWQAGLQAAREAVDLPRLEAEREALFSRRNAALALARDTPAKTLVGLAVKARTARNMEAGIDLRRAACRKDDDAAEGFFYTLAADVLGIAAPLAAGAQPEAATASLADQILTCWRDYGTDIGMGDEEENEATRALNKRRSDLIDAAEALPATRENVPAKALALAWLEYVDLWRNGDARRLHRRWPPRPRHRHGRLRPADDGVLSVADVLTFHARRPAPSISRSDVLDGPSLRLELEQAAQAALDQAERLIALLDRMDGEPDDEDGGDAELSLGAPEGHASQVIWLRGSDFDLETTSENRA